MEALTINGVAYNMTEEHMKFLPKGLASISAHLDEIPRKTQSLYLSFLIDELGKKLGHLPTKSVEKKLMAELNEALDNKISSAIQLETLKRLNSNREERILKNGRELLEKTPTQNLKALIRERSRTTGR